MTYSSVAGSCTWSRLACLAPAGRHHRRRSPCTWRRTRGASTRRRARSHPSRSCLAAIHHSSTMNNTLVDLTFNKTRQQFNTSKYDYVPGRRSDGTCDQTSQRLPRRSRSRAQSTHLYHHQHTSHLLVLHGNFHSNAPFMNAPFVPRTWRWRSGVISAASVSNVELVLLKPYCYQGTQIHKQS